MNRTERRAAAAVAAVEAARKAEFVAKMNRAKEAKVAQKLYLERGVKVASMPTPEALAMVAKYAAKKAKLAARKGA